MDHSNIQVFALSLLGGFIIIPNRVGPTHLWRKDRQVAVWASRGCCLSKERLRIQEQLQTSPPPPHQSSPHSQNRGGREICYWGQPVRGTRLAWQSLQPKESPPDATGNRLAGEKPETHH